MQTTLQGRSYQRGEITLEELAALTAGFNYASALLDEDLLGNDYDAVVVDGDLHLPSLTLGAPLAFLVVTGNLVIDGACVDCDEPATGLYVLGNLQAGSVWTGGMLGVQGDLTVARTLAGFYNDYAAIVKGTTRAAVFFPENHYFQFEGAPTFDVVLGNAAPYRVPKQWAAQVTETLKGRALLDRAVGLESEDLPALSAEQIETFGATELLDAHALYTRVQADSSVLSD